MPHERVWHVGDYVEIELKKECGGGIFSGVLHDMTEEYVMFSSGYGFANGTIADIRLVPR